MANDDYKEVAIQSAPIGAIIGATLIFPATLTCSWWVLQPREEAIVLHFGVLTDYVTKAGIQFHMAFGREIKTISTAQMVIVIPTLKVTDKIGNPVLVSAVCTCRVVDAKKALLNVQNPRSFVEAQASAVLKQVVSEFSYDELKTEVEHISGRMLKWLQPKVDIAGVMIQSCALNELNYSEQIAKAMLKKQQATALVEARHLLVHGSVEIAKHTVEKLKENGIDMSNEERARLVRSMVVICTGDTHAMPTLSL